MEQAIGISNVLRGWRRRITCRFKIKKVQPAKTNYSDGLTLLQTPRAKFAPSRLDNLSRDENCTIGECTEFTKEIPRPKPAFPVVDFDQRLFNQIKLEQSVLQYELRFSVALQAEVS